MDSSGNPDPTPDKATFKVIKKKKKHHRHHKHRHHRSAQVAADFS